MASSNRWLAIAGSVIALTVVVGIAVTVIAGGEQVYNEGTPERAVQRYLHAVSDHDVSGAMSYLAPELAKKCDDRLRTALTSRTDRSIRATLDRSMIREGDAEVHVRIAETYASSSPFGSGDYSFTEVFLLSREGGQWQLTETP